MSLLADIRQRTRIVAPQVFAAALVGYFAFHSFQGDHGVRAWARLSEDLAGARTVLADLTQDRKLLEHRVDLLRRGHLDPDLLEERARRILNYGGRDDYIIMLDDK